MTSSEFREILDRRIDLMRQVLDSKAADYAKKGDRLHNFRRAATDFPDAKACTPAEACVGMMRKHWVSIADLVDSMAAGTPIPVAAIDEKIGDAVNYLVLLEALLRCGGR